MSTPRLFDLNGGPHRLGSGCAQQPLPFADPRAPAGDKLNLKESCRFLQHIVLSQTYSCLAYSEWKWLHSDIHFITWFNSIWLFSENPVCSAWPKRRSHHRTSLLPSTFWSTRPWLSCSIGFADLQKSARSHQTMKQQSLEWAILSLSKPFVRTSAGWSCFSGYSFGF